MKKVRNTMMKKNPVIKELLKGINLTGSDAARLALEAIETLGDLACGLRRQDLIALLRRTIQQGVAAVKDGTHTVTLEAAAWASVEARQDLRPSSKRDLRHFVRRILRVNEVSNLPLRAMTTSQCKVILETAFSSSVCSYIKGRAVLHSIFSYGIRQEWCDGNPVSRIEVPKVKERRIQPLNLAEVERLKQTARLPEFREMSFSLCLMLYGGIRPTEVSRLKQQDFNWEEGLVIIRPMSSKTGGGRIVPLRGIQHIRKQDRFIPRDWQRKWQALRRAAGYRHGMWVPDVCRHTFASYHAAYFKNLPELQWEMGHRDMTLLRSRYVVPTSPRDAARFWLGADTA